MQQMPRVSLPLVSIIIACASYQTVLGQGTPFACCFGGSVMRYGMCGSGDETGVRTWPEFKACWQQSLTHFSNNTVIGEYNVTMAEKYSAFTIILDSAVSSITADPADPLQFDADVFANASTPELGYLPFMLSIVLPQTAPNSCPPFELKDLALRVSLHDQKPRDPHHQYAGFSLRIGGCGRTQQVLSNFSLEVCRHSTQARYTQIFTQSIMTTLTPLSRQMSAS